MGVLNLTYRGGDFHPALDPAAPLAAALEDAAGDVAPGAPVVVLVHGYRYDPSRPKANPHASLYAIQPDPRLPRRQMSWLGALGFRGQPQDPGLCIAVGWSARGRLAEAYERAAEVGAALSDLVSVVAEMLPGRPIKVMGHSLGARVALCCLDALRAPDVAQVILLAPAEFTDTAHRVLGNPAARAADILQISPVENWLFDRLLARALRRRGMVLGQCAPYAPNWVSLSLDSDGELAQLAALGHQVAPRKARICHWSAYLRGGLMDLYAAVLTGPDCHVFKTFSGQTLKRASVVTE
jgi:pimeloyl-ACP methyl ester carboxylesterase